MAAESRDERTASEGLASRVMLGGSRVQRSFILSLRLIAGPLALAALVLAAACSGGGGTTPAPPTAPLPVPFGGTVAVPSNGALLFPGQNPRHTIRLDIGDGVPSGETLTHTGSLPPGILVVSSFIDGVTFSVGPNPMPASALRDVVLDFGGPPPGSPIEALISEVGAGAGSPLRENVLPIAVAPSTNFQMNGSWTGAPLTTLQPGLSYWIFIGFSP
jgi:hypothetical protein